MKPTDKDRYRLAGQLAALGWQNAEEKEFGTAYLAYKLADRFFSEGSLNAELCLLRHKVGEVKKPSVIEPIEATEDIVSCLYLLDTIPETREPDMVFTDINGDNLKKNISLFMDRFSPGFHITNIKKELPHIFFMSTGRCGTMSVYKLLRQSHYVPYHTYWWQNAVTSRWEAMCRFISGNINAVEPVFQEWLSLRAAEWIGAISVDKPMAAINHMDTIFAPAFAAIHGKSKFIHLRRSPIAVFRSFYGKDQWLVNQLEPVLYKFDPTFKTSAAGLSLPEVIAWYIKFTEVFSRSMGEIMGDRYIEISSDKLFMQDQDEIKRLCDFTEIDVPFHDVVVHFHQKINEKSHKKHKIPDNDMAIFKNALCRF